MAEWIPYDVKLPRKPEFTRIRRALGKSKNEMVGIFMQFWAWAQEVTSDGLILGCDTEMMDSEAGVKGFGEAMLKEKWAVQEGENIRLPNWDRFLGNGFKSRCLNAERQARFRRNSNARVTPLSRSRNADVTLVSRLGNEIVTPIGQDRTGEEKTEQEQQEQDERTELAAAPAAPSAPADIAERRKKLRKPDWLPDKKPWILPRSAELIARSNMPTHQIDELLRLAKESRHTLDNPAAWIVSQWKKSSERIVGH